MPDRPSRNDGLAIACPICAAPFAPSGRRRYCSDTCRQAAWRRRHPVSLPPLPPRRRRAATIYECGGCEARYYEKAMAKRKVWVEPLFGEAKDWHGLERFRLRGLWKVNVEALLIATGQNLKRLPRKRGWGHRPWPNGAPEAPSARRLVPQPPTWSPSLV